MADRVDHIDEGYCFHDDFINGWYDDAAKAMLKAKGQSFLRIDGAHGNGKTYSECKAKESRIPKTARAITTRAWR